MNWLVHHTLSEQYANQAEEFHRQQEFDRAVELYRLAAEREKSALESLDYHKIRTIGITAISTASLYYKAREFALAKRLAHKWLGSEFLPPFAVDELEELLQVIHYEETRQKSGIPFVQGEVLVSVSGGDVMYGAAPLDVILKKVKQIRDMFYRTTEFLLDQPLRGRSEPTSLVKNNCDPWLFQAPAGSYQFAVRVRKPQIQLTIPGLVEAEAELRIEQITQKFLEIIRATTEDPEGELNEIVQKEDYRKKFMKLTRELTPPTDGKSFSQLTIKSSDEIEPRPVLLLPDTRQTINQALKKAEPITPETSENKRIQLTGILRGLQLDRDWIEVSINGKNETILDAKEDIDDLIGPMVNRRVVVDVIEKINRSQEKVYLYQDIQLEEDL
jgi:hypothetical protein